MPKIYSFLYILCVHMRELQPPILQQRKNVSSSLTDATRVMPSIDVKSVLVYIISVCFLFCCFSFLYTKNAHVTMVQRRLFIKKNIKFYLELIYFFHIASLFGYMYFKRKQKESKWNEKYSFDMMIWFWAWMTLLNTMTQNNLIWLIEGVNNYKVTR